MSDFLHSISIPVAGAVNFSLCRDESSSVTFQHVLDNHVLCYYIVISTVSSRSHSNLLIFPLTSIAIVCVCVCMCAWG